jgi:hypothetical protein
MKQADGSNVVLTEFTKRFTYFNLTLSKRKNKIFLKYDKIWNNKSTEKIIRAYAVFLLKL